MADSDDISNEEDFGIKELEIPKPSGRKDAIGEEEKLLYRKAIEKNGNNWKKLIFIYENGVNLLPGAVYDKYKAAVKENKTKPIRSRLGNIERKVKDSKEVTKRETTHVYDTQSASSIQEMAVKIQHAKTKESQDPLHAAHVSSDDDKEDSTGLDCLEASPSSSSKTKDPPLRKPRTKKRKIEELMEKASNVMEVATKASKAHFKYLKSMAVANEISLSDSDD